MSEEKNLLNKVFLALMTNTHVRVLEATAGQGLTHEEVQDYVLHVYKDYEMYFGIDSGTKAKGPKITAIVDVSKSGAGRAREKPRAAKQKVEKKSQKIKKKK